MSKWDTCVEKDGTTYCWDDDVKQYVALEIKQKSCTLVPIDVANKITALIISRNKGEKK